MDKQNILTVFNNPRTYTVAVGSSYYDDGYPAPDLTCGHAHKTVEAAEKCGTKLYAAKIVRGSWQARAPWHNWYVLGTHEEYTAARLTIYSD